MNHLARSAALVALLGAGIASGIGLTTVLGGAKSADPCFGTGAGSLDRVITAPEANGGKKYNVCSKLGQRVIFDAQTGEVVDVSLFEDQLVDYYKQNPDQNPRIIAEKTYAAEFAVNSFTTPDIPTPATDDCPPDASRQDFPAAGVSVCVPKSWTVTDDSSQGIILKGDSSVVGIYGADRHGTEGTKCVTPARVTLKTGAASVCALNKGPEGGQGHGIILGGGREMGVSFIGPVPEAQRAFVFQIAFSVEVK